MSGLLFFVLLVVLGIAALLAFAAQVVMIIVDVGMSWWIGNTFIGGMRILAQKEAHDKGDKPPSNKPFGEEVSFKEAFWVNFFVGKRMRWSWLVSILLMIGALVYGGIALIDHDRTFTGEDFALLLARTLLLCAFLVAKSYLSGLYVGASLCAIIYNLVEHGRWRGVPGVIKAVNWIFGSANPFWEAAYWWSTSLWTGAWTAAVVFGATILITTKGDF